MLYYVSEKAFRSGDGTKERPFKKIGDAVLLAARTRPKYIGGCRAVYDDDL